MPGVQLKLAVMCTLASLLLNGEVRQVSIEKWRIAPPTSVASGDLVFRRDNGVWSSLFINASKRDRRFSHAGIVVIEGGCVKVIHADANEHTGVGCVRSEDWSGFFSQSLDGALYRFTGDRESGRKIGDEARHRLGVPFDTGFDMTQTNKLYCSEFVREAVNSAIGRKVIGFTPTAETGGYVAIDDCYRGEMVLLAECGANMTKF